MNIADDTAKGRSRRASAPAATIKVKPVSPWPRRWRRLLRGCATLAAALLLSLTFSIAALLAAETVDPAIVAIALAITAAIMLLTRGLDTPTIAALCATLAVTASQSSGIDFLVAGQSLLERHLPDGEVQNLLRHLTGP